MRPASPSFLTTRWSQVQRATGNDEAAAREALAALCEGYWYPIYAYFRRAGQGAPDAEDLTQGFFAWLVERGTFAAADAGKGKLRTFLLTCASRFLSDARDRAAAQKRGGGLVTSFDATDAEERYEAEPHHDLSPDRLFQRRWALTVLDHGLALLRAEYEASGKAELFTALRPFLGFGPEPERRYDEVSKSLGQPVNTLKSHVFRLRKRWRELIFEQVSETLSDGTPEEIRAELGELLGYV